MKKALIRRSRICRRDAGVTIIFVAICMVAIVAMAALSIDVVTLYLARMEAQRTADTAALAAARVISLSGITGDPNNTSGDWSQICGGSSGVATLAAQAVATQTVDNVAPTVTVTYSVAGTSGSGTDCTAYVPGTGAFAVNPMVTVQVTRSNLPTFFSHMWGNTGSTTTATATAEAFNPSNSSAGATGVITPVWPRCVKPWMVPNQDPLNPAPSGGNYCNQGSPPGSCSPLVNQTTGQIRHAGISLSGSGTNGVIGETFWLSPDCQPLGSSCTLRVTQPAANYVATGRTVSDYEGSPNLLYVPGQAINSSVAVPSTGSGDLYEDAISGCDQTTVYQCGSASSSLSSPNLVDLSENPVSTDDTTNGVLALTHQGTAGASVDGQDYINDENYPFQLLAGTSNRMLSASLASGSPITNSSSIVSVPIYDSQTTTTITPPTTQVTIVGFLQVFINYVDSHGNVQVTVLNVSGCGNGTSTTGTAVAGSSPVPIRLVSQ
jgi:Putative Flp pilus-assembly TadE/G-like